MLAAYLILKMLAVYLTTSLLGFLDCFLKFFIINNPIMNMLYVCVLFAVD
jgi:hypothetical protein